MKCREHYQLKYSLKMMLDPRDIIRIALREHDNEAGELLESMTEPEC